MVREVCKCKLIIFNTGQKFYKFCKYWFSIGFFVSLFISALCTGILLYSFVGTIFQVDHSQPSLELSQEEVKPIYDIKFVLLIPGVNIPLSDIPYLALALLISAVLHELGHALAAAIEGVNVQECGIFIFFVLPTAYVSLPGDELEQLNPWAKLKIYCAGAWHNIVLSFIIFVALSIFFSGGGMILRRSEGAVVANVHSKSALYGHLKPGDVIVELNGCVVKDSQSWNTCLRDQYQNQKKGYCVSKKIIDTEIRRNGRQCCKEPVNYQLCFHYYEPETRENETACLLYRETININRCKTNEDCKKRNDRCVKVEEGELFSIKVLDREPTIIYYGNVVDLATDSKH